VSAELAPYASTGGLGEMCASLQRNVHQQGHDIRALAPFHEQLTDPETVRPVDGLDNLELTVEDRAFAYSVVTPVDHHNGAVYMIRCPQLFDRPSIYTSDRDEPVRFGLFCRVVLEVLERMEWSPEVLHLHDWHTALTPLLLHTTHGGIRRFTGLRTLLTLHNISYQGTFSPSALSDLGLSGYISFFYGDDLEHGRISFLTTGALYADQLTTVSRTYAAEIQERATGAGLDELLRARRDQLVGIVNGIDTNEWDPTSDPRLPANYSVDDLAGKAVCRSSLLAELGLTANDDAPVLAVVSRLTYQKGLDLIEDGLEEALADGCCLVALGRGEPSIEQRLEQIRSQHPDRVGLFTRYDPELAHRIQAGADMILMPSRWEPCGLSQLYGLRYGTVPIVRRTGGLADTVVDAEDPEGTGFVFEEASPEAFRRCLERARHAFQSTLQWQALVERGMRQDWAWHHQSQQYIDLYTKLAG
jgi:starch synthase